MPRLEHIGIAVSDVNGVVDCFQDLLDITPYKSEMVAAQQVRTHFLEAGAKLELLESVASDSPVQSFLDRRGEGVHHLAFEVDDLTATMDRLRGAGFKLLSERPQSGADDKQVVFVHPKQTHGVLVEFCETEIPTWPPTQVPRHDGHLSVFERGDPGRPSLLCLHGAAGTTRHELAPLMRRLESSFHLVGLDLSGHGTSAFPNDTLLSLDLFAEDARQVLDALGLSSVHVFGFSLGGGVALRFAQRHPDRVDRLAVFQTNVQWSEDQVERMQHRLDLDALQERAPARADRLLSRHDAPERLLRHLRRFVEALPDMSQAMWDTLSEITAPTLVGAVDQDPLIGLAPPQALHDQLPNARLTVLPGSHHSLSDLQPDLLASLLRPHYTLPH